MNAFTNWGELVDKHLAAHLTGHQSWPLILKESNRYRKKVRPGRYWGMFSFSLNQGELAIRNQHTLCHGSALVNVTLIVQNQLPSV